MKEDEIRMKEKQVSLKIQLDLLSDKIFIISGLIASVQDEPLDKEELKATIGKISEINKELAKHSDIIRKKELGNIKVIKAASKINTIAAQNDERLEILPNLEGAQFSSLLKEIVINLVKIENELKPFMRKKFSI